MIDSMYHRDNQQETEQFIRKMARSKVPFKDMVTELNRLKRTRTVPWAVSAIKEVLKRPEQVPLKIDVVPGHLLPDEDQEALKIEPDWTVMAEQFQKALDYVKKQREEEERPIDWRSPEAWVKKGIVADLYKEVGFRSTASHDRRESVPQCMRIAVAQVRS